MTQIHLHFDARITDYLQQVGKAVEPNNGMETGAPGKVYRLDMPELLVHLNAGTYLRM